MVREKRLIVTRADENIQDITDVSFPLIQWYAKRCGADFMVLDGDSPYDVGNGRYHYRIMVVGELLRSGYDRVLHLDADIIISPKCVDLFDWVHPFKVGSVLEDKGTRQDDRRARIAKIQEAWGDVSWTEGYINTGVFVVSRCHDVLFRPWVDEQGEPHYWTESGFDDVHLGWMIHYECQDVCELPYKLNHMSMFSEPWNGNADRLKSDIIHYAGGAKFPGTGWHHNPFSNHTVALMKMDKERLWASK